MQSRIFPIGHEMGHVNIISRNTKGDRQAAIFILCLLVHIAIGKISPNTTILAVDTIITWRFGKIIYNTKGKLSIAPALQINRVLNIQWCLSITLKILEALGLSEGSRSASISKPNLSIEERPTVSPDIIPQVKTSETATAEIYIISIVVFVSVS